MGSQGPGKATVDGEEKMKKKFYYYIIAFLSVSFVLSGCGYTTRSMISDKFRTIYIVPFVNKVDITQETYVGSKYKIYRPMLETDITRAVTNKYLFDGNLRPTKTDAADLTLKGELVDYRKDPLRYDTNDEVEEYRINLVVNIRLWDNKEDKLVWEENNFTGDAAYYPASSTLQNVVKKSDDQAVSDALDDLARRIVERTVEEW